MSYASGKLAPRLQGDILEYDPVALTGSGYHPLNDVPQYNEDRPTPSQRGNHSCTHDWKLDQDRTSIPTPASKNQGYLVAHCHNCRAHLAVVLSFDHVSEQQPFQPCPKEDFPMHHFVHLPNSSLPLPLIDNAEEPTRDMDLQLFQCSSETCGAKIYVSYSPARLLQQWIDQLTDENAIARRHERVSRNDPIRFEGIGVPTVMDVLSYLREYVTNALASDEQRIVQPANKKFMLSFGETPRELFEYLDFEYSVCRTARVSRLIVDIASRAKFGDHRVPARHRIIHFASPRTII